LDNRVVDKYILPVVVVVVAIAALGPQQAPVVQVVVAPVLPP
jgi:hypothetical protein